ncbi:helix-turn-helix domain-containing protein [Pseudonocardia aurantiaca]|uniref:Transposase n=1 Tax=Pseudonocardia aurantiaca TaxID=75290 RepID=A0ABW4FRJ9_9PSEU
MARQPEVFVRALEPEEAQRLVKITRTAKDRVRLRRAGIVLTSVQGRSAADAAAMFAATAQYAREVIHAFNEQGFAALDPKWSGGRPRRFGPAVRELVCRVAKTPPQQLGRPFTTWSLSKLVEHLGEHHRIVISTETVRAILRDADIRWQATKTWKGSRDPDFTAKMARSSRRAAARASLPTPAHELHLWVRPGPPRSCAFRLSILRLGDDGEDARGLRAGEGRSHP